MPLVPDPSVLSSGDKDALIRTLLAQLHELAERVKALEAENAALREKLNLPPKTPQNSSTPPSQGHKANGAPGNRRKGKAHPGAARALHPNPTQHCDVAARQCQHCQANVSAVPQAAVQSYDRIELPEIKPDVTRVTLRGGVCPCCGRRFKAAPPAGLEPGSPFGPNLRAFVLYLRYSQAISFERLRQLLSDLLGLPISEGALNNMLDASRQAFAWQASLIRQHLLAGAALQSDETSMRVGKRTWWNWVFHHADSACFVIRPSRASAVVAEFLGAVRPDYWVSDRYGAQMGWAAREHQFCLAHLLRDVQYAVDAGDGAFAPGLKRLLQQATGIGQRRDSLTDGTLRAYAAKLDRKLDALLRILPGNRPGEKLQGMIKKVRQHLFVFITNRDIPATNNGSEQALRPCVTFRKVTNCFRSQWGAELYADIRSVIETARRRTVGACEAIRLTLRDLPLPDRRPVPAPTG
jgi:transposase